MNVEDKPAFLEVMLGMAELRRVELSAQALELWWNAMKPWPLDAFRQAANHLTRSSAFMPTPADFWRLRSAGELTAAEAWPQVLANVRRSEYRRGVTPGGRIDRAVQAIGGYRAVGAAAERDLQFMERRFAEAYADLKEIDSTRQALPAVVNRTQLEKLHAAIGSDTTREPT